MWLRLLGGAFSASAAGRVREVTDFGSNPGNLRMLAYAWEAANERLTSLIAALSDASLVPATIADRLVKLLPRGNSTSFTPRERSLPADPTLRFRMSANMILICVLVMAGVLFAQWAAGLQPKHESITHEPPSHTVDQTVPSDQLNR
jgi:hypothetical protein